MNISEIVKDAVKYPFSDWKKILIFGIIILFGDMSFIIRSQNYISITNGIIFFLGIISFLIILLVKGYSFRIVTSSLKGLVELPKFNLWSEMFKDGINLFIVPFVYGIPAILVILIFAAVSFISNPLLVVNIVSGIVIWAFVGGSGISSIISLSYICFFIVILYIFIILPIIAIAIAHMANNDGKLVTAFRFHEIIDKISSIGWSNLIIWYIVTLILYLVLYIISEAIIMTALLLIKGFGGTEPEYYILLLILPLLIVNPYLTMYLFKSVALLYES